MTTRERHPAWKHVCFVGANVGLVFALLQLLNIVLPFLEPSLWLNALVFSIVFNAVALPIHIRKFGPVWITPAYGPLYGVWASLRRLVRSPTEVPGTRRDDARAE